MKNILNRIVSMLTKLGRRGYTVSEEEIEYEKEKINSSAEVE